MLVRDWMTPNPVSVSPDTPVLDALKLLKEHSFRRLPVMDGQNLVGIVTDKDLKDAMPSKATTLSVWELNYLLAKLTVHEVMAKPVITIEADQPLEDAALLMQEYKVTQVATYKIPANFLKLWAKMNPHTLSTKPWRVVA